MKTINEYINDYVNIYLKLKNVYEKLKQFDKNGNLETKEGNILKTTLRKHSIQENIIINNLYHDYISPYIVDYEDAKILVFMLKELFLLYLDKLDLIDIDLIHQRIELVMLNIFDSERRKFSNLDKNKENNSILKELYTKEEIESLSPDDIYDVYKTYNFIINEANLHTLLFLQKEIDSNEDLKLREVLIEKKYDFIILNKYIEKAIIFDSKNLFNFNFNHDKETNLLNDKFDICRRIAGLKMFSNGMNGIFGMHNIDLDDKEREALMIGKKCLLKSALLLLDEKDIVNLQGTLKQSFDSKPFEFALEFNQELSIINGVFKTRKLDKGFSRNLRIAD